MLAQDITAEPNVSRKYRAVCVCECLCVAFDLSVESRGILTLPQSNEDLLSSYANFVYAYDICGRYGLGYVRIQISFGSGKNIVKLLRRE